MVGNRNGRATRNLVLVLLLPALFVLVPTRALEAHPAPCLWRALFGVRCPGCGMTRALSCALHGRWRDAWRYNPLIAVALPLLAWEWWQLAARTWRELASAAYTAGTSSAD